MSKNHNMAETINLLWRGDSTHTLPLAEFIWKQETENKVFDTPESRAGLERRFRELTLGIEDPDSIRVGAPAEKIGFKV